MFRACERGLRKFPAGQQGASICEETQRHISVK